MKKEETKRDKQLTNRVMSNWGEFTGYAIWFTWKGFWLATGVIISMKICGVEL